METVKKIWRDALSVLETEASAISFDVWIRPLEAVDIDGDKLVLVAPTDGNVIAINNQLRPLICEVLHRINPLISDIELRVSSSSPAGEAAVSESVPEPEPEPKNKIQLGFDSGLINPRYTFDNFVVGKCNQLVVAAAKAVVMTPGTLYNPLFIYGGVGLGKTHIMHAIGNAIRKNDCSLKVVYISSEKFVNEFIEAIRISGGAGEFREKYRSADVLMIDDIQFISKKAGTQEELFHTFNDLCQANKQLIFASDRAPKEIPDIEDRLRSRFEWGLIADIQPPDLETRIAILQKKAEMENAVVDNRIIEYIVDNVAVNIRTLEGALQTVISTARISNQPITLELAERTIKNKVAHEKHLTQDIIITKVCEYYGLSREKMMGTSRKKDVLLPRQVSMYFCRSLLAMSLPAIGKLFRKDHSTVSNAIDKIEEGMQQDPLLQSDIHNIRRAIES